VTSFNKPCICEFLDWSGYLEVTQKAFSTEHFLELMQLVLTLHVFTLWAEKSSVSWIHFIIFFLSFYANPLSSSPTKKLNTMCLALLFATTQVQSAAPVPAILPPGCRLLSHLYPCFPPHFLSPCFIIYLWPRNTTRASRMRWTWATPEPKPRSGLPLFATFSTVSGAKGPGGNG
jgi:hypothetical protein